MTAILFVITLGGQARAESNDHIPEFDQHLFASIPWGASSNGLRCGVKFPGVENLRKPGRLECSVYISSDNYEVLIRPLAEQSLDIWLRQTNGSFVPNKRFGKTLAVDRELLQEKHLKSYWKLPSDARALIVFGKTSAAEVRNFNIAKCFKLKEPGNYTLILEARFIKKNKDGSFELIHLPKVSAKVEIYESDLELAK